MAKNPAASQTEAPFCSAHDLRRRAQAPGPPGGARAGQQKRPPQSAVLRAYARGQGGAQSTGGHPMNWRAAGAALDAGDEVGDSVLQTKPDPHRRGARDIAKCAQRSATRTKPSQTQPPWFQRRAQRRNWSRRSRRRLSPISSFFGWSIKGKIIENAPAVTTVVAPIRNPILVPAARVPERRSGPAGMTENSIWNAARKKMNAIVEKCKVTLRKFGFPLTTLTSSRATTKRNRRLPIICRAPVIKANSVQASA